MNGKKLINEMRKVRNDIPSILITGYGDLITRENIGDWGINDLLVKPFEFDELSKTVSKVLNEHKKANSCLLLVNSRLLLVN